MIGLRCVTHGTAGLVPDLHAVLAVLEHHIATDGCRGQHRLIDARRRVWAASPTTIRERIQRGELEPSAWVSIEPTSARGRVDPRPGRAPRLALTPERGPA